MGVIVERIWENIKLEKEEYYESQMKKKHPNLKLMKFEIALYTIPIHM